MKQTVFTIIFLAVLQFAQAQNGGQKATSTGQYYEGTINGNLKIQMYLEFVGMQPDNKMQNYAGWYYYESQGSSNKIKLKGTSYMNTFNLEEITNGRKTGDFSFSPSGGYFQGTWKGTNGKTFPVKLKMK